MLEFEDLVYLDVQKTGSTYIKDFLRKFSRGEEINYKRHASVEARRPGALYLISCRDPLRCYVSLYSFGCMGKGGLAQRLDRRGMGHFYTGVTAGFIGWLEFILDPQKSQEFLAPMDKHRILDFVGLQTLRFLFLAFPSPRTVFDQLTDREALTSAFASDGLADVVIKTENLNQDLGDLVRGAHAGLFKDHAEASSYLVAERKKNRSPSFDIDLAAVPAELLSMVQAREWLFFEHLGYAPYR